MSYSPSISNLVVAMTTESVSSLKSFSTCRLAPLVGLNGVLQRNGVCLQETGINIALLPLPFAEPKFFTLVDSSIVGHY